MNQQHWIDIILERGTENVIPSKAALTELLSGDKKLNIYLGIDPTATHIHLGHAVPLRKLQAFAELGHNVYFLIGDFTALVGDTSDKNTERPILTKEEIEQNFQTYKEQASKILDFSKVNVVHNSDWLSELKFGDVLSLTRHFSLNDFMSRELIRNRMNEGKRVGLAEVLYPIMQGYDSFHLDTDVQLGGTDQTFNMQAGRSLIKEMKKKESFVLTNGFLVGTDGRKMSKSWGNAIWLDDEPSDIFGKIMSIQDDLIREYFTLATSLPLSEIDEIMTKFASEPMQLKKELARNIITELCSAEDARSAEEHFAKTVQNKEAPEDVSTVPITNKTMAVAELFQILVNEGLIPSKTEGWRLHTQKALYLDGQPIEETSFTLQPGENTIRIGKRKYLKLALTEK
jgi:tyrosyl-tRNA synthetase